MSNPGRLALRFVAVLFAITASANASAQFEGIDAYAQAIAALTTSWKGQRVPRPSPRPRPEMPFVLRSVFEPVSVHTDLARPEDAPRALAAIERTADWMRREGWPAPIPDGGRGGDGGFDLYLGPIAEVGPWRAEADPDLAWGSLDGISSFARLDPAADESLEACASAAYVDAVLYGQDPAEAAAWRRATANFLAWRITGRFCQEIAVAWLDEGPWLTWPVGDEAEGAEAGRLVGLLSSQRDAGDGEFLRDMWQFARQRTYETGFLRGSPDLWECIEAYESFRKRSLDGLLMDVAAARYAHRARTGSAIPLYAHVRWSDLPARPPISSPALETLGSAYTQVDVEGARAGEILRVWVRGEFGVRWGLVAVQRDARGRELSRMVAPARQIAPRAYLPVEIHRGARSILIVVTNLSHRRPDADVPDNNERAFRLVLDRAP